MSLSLTRVAFVAALVFGAVPYAPAQDTNPRQRYLYVQIKKTI